MAAPRLGHARRVAIAVVIAGAVALAGCQAVTSAVIRDVDGALILANRSECDFVIDRVEVRYEGEGHLDDLPLVWSAEAVGDQRAEALVLFRPNVGYDVTQTADSIDLGREMVVSWRETSRNGPEFDNAISGVLSDVEGDQILSFDGVGSAFAYEWGRMSPLSGYRC